MTARDEGAVPHAATDPAQIGTAQIGTVPGGTVPGDAAPGATAASGPAGSVAPRAGPGADADARLACVPGLVARSGARGTVHVAEDGVPADVCRGRSPPSAARGACHADVAVLCASPDLGSLDGVLFLDTETTGLGGGAGTFVFLLGVAWFEGDVLRTRQWLLPDPADEEAFLDGLEEEASRSRAVVTFHGRGFDLPRLEERCLLAGRRFPFARHAHVDLLTGARRVFKLRTGHVALQQLEREVLGVRRLDDLPGAECPAAWYDYLRGRGAAMRRVLEHNLLDLLSLPALYAALSDVAAGDGVASDLHGAGRAFAQVAGRAFAQGAGRASAQGVGGASAPRAQGESPQAESSQGGHALRLRALSLQRRALVAPAVLSGAAADAPDVTARAHAEIAALLRRLGDAEGAAAAALAAVRVDPALSEPWLALAKYAEHTRRDVALALDCALRLRRLADERGATARQRAAVEHRIARLERRRDAPA